jgi:N-acetyl-gamma-glutamyl-phosphate reductase
MSRITVGLVGVSGYTGMELARLLVGHPGFELTRATSRAEAGKLLGDIYPFLRSFPLAELRISQPDPEDLAAACELVFLAVPHGAAMDLAAPLRAKGLKVVDLSADFRLRDPEVYASWYGHAHRQTGLLAEAVYGIPELNPEQIAQAKLLANPGCYPTCSILGLHPALKHKLVDPDGIVIDAKSGTTGAGRKASVGTLFCEVQDSFRAYNLGKHRHTPEIEQELSAVAGRELFVSFNTHLLPINRGILSTIYCKLPQPLELAQVLETYQKTYAGAGWIRVLPAGQLPELRHVRGTMFCDIGLVVDPRTQRLLIVSAIDNLCRGASGQALANANLMCGQPLRLGLDLPPLMP